MAAGGCAHVLYTVQMDLRCSTVSHGPHGYQKRDKIRIIRAASEGDLMLESAPQLQYNNLPQTDVDDVLFELL